MIFRHLTRHRLIALLHPVVFPPAGKREMRHLRECPHCRGRMEDLREMEQMLASLPVQSPSAHFSERVMLAVGNDACMDAEAKQSGRKRNMYMQNEFVNGMIAIAATFLFASSGMLQTLVRIDVYRLNNEINMWATTSAQWLATISETVRVLVS